MNDTEMQEIKSILAENEELKAQLAAAIEVAKSAQADTAAALHASETYRTGFEAQQTAHNEAIKIIEKLQAQLKNTKADGQPTADK